MAKLTLEEKELTDRGIKKWNTYICRLAFKYRNRIADIDDLMQEGYMAIMRAAKIYEKDHENGATFETLAFSCITNCIFSVSSATCSPVSIPRGSGSLIDNYDDYQRGGDIETVTIGNSEDDVDLLDLIEAFDIDNIGYHYFIERYSLEEIAIMKNKSRSTIGRIVNKIRCKIEKELQL